MKIVFLTDVHLDASIAGFDPHQDIVKALDLVIEEASEADLVVIGGDLFHSQRPSPRANAAAIHFINALSCPVVCVRGNHDTNTYAPLEEINQAYAGVIDDMLSSISYDEGVAARKVLAPEEPMLVGIRGFKQVILVLPWLQARVKNRAEAIEDALEQGRKVGAKVAFCHLDIPGAVSPAGKELPCGPASIPMDVARKCAFPIFAGHVHKRQKVGPINIVGSLGPTEFEEGRSGGHFVVLEV